MDILRSRYKPKMRFFTDAGLIDVVWFKAAPNAQIFPGIHSFASEDFEDEPEDLALGESRPPRGAWANGQRPSLLRGNGFLRGTVDAFLNGQETIDLVPIGVTCANEPLDLAIYPLAIPGKDDSDSAEGFISFGTGGLRWAEEQCIASNTIRLHLLPRCLNVPETFDVVLSDSFTLPDDDGRFTVQWEQASLSWKGDTVFNCLLGFSFTVHCEVKAITSKQMEVTFKAESSGCGGPASMYGLGSFVDGSGGGAGTIFPLIGNIPQIDSPSVVSFWLQGAFPL